MVSKIPFYTLSQEDHLAFSLQEKGKIDKNGRVINQGSLKESDYEISLDIRLKLTQLFKKTIPIEGRCYNVPLGIISSLEEVKNSTFSVSDKKIKVIFQGSGMLSFLTPLMERIFTKWCADSCSEELNVFITPLFKSITPNDYDFKFELDEAGDSETIVNQGLVELLAEKLKKKVFRPDLLALELDKYKNKIINKSVQSYVKKIFAGYPRIRSSLPDLHVLFVKAFAFQKAADVSTVDTRFSERKMGGSQSLSYDCFFSKRTLQTTTPLNSLYIDVTDLLEGKDGSFYLESTLGPKKKLQALSDANLRIMTFDAKKPAERGDFARTISFFTLGGRCYQEGWLQKSITAFEAEVKAEKIDFPELLAAQLIGRLIDHHQNQPAVLVALAFNASALLLTLRPSYKDEIQKFWRLIFSHLDKIEETFHHVMSQPFVEHIQMIMRDPSFNFEDLYYQIQVTTALKQNCSAIPYDKYPCKSTQTDGRIFNQIQVTIPRSENDKAYSMIFFSPYHLLGAIQYLNRFIHLPPTITTCLSRFHDIFIEGRSLVFNFGNSPLKEYIKDPRRTYLECLTHAKQLLTIKHEHSWLMGYLLTLSSLAQKNDIKESQELLISFSKMLQEKWASENFKKKVIEILHQTLSNSGITNELIFNGLEKKKTLTHILNWIQTSIKSHWTPLSHLAFEYMDNIEKEKSEEECIAFYNEIIKRYRDSKIGQVEEATLKVLVPRIAFHAKLPLNSKLEWIFRLCSNQSLISGLELHQILFNNLIEVFKKVNEFQEEQKSTVLTELLCLLQTKNLVIDPSSILSLAQEIFRLRFLDHPKSLYLFWDQLISYIPQSTEMAILYQEKCLDLARGFNLWDKLNDQCKQTFTQLFVENIKKQPKQNRDRSSALAKIDPKVLDTKTNQQEINLIFKEVLIEKLQDELQSETEVQIVFALLERINWALEKEIFLFSMALEKLSNIALQHSSLYQIRKIIKEFCEKYFKNQNKEHVVNFYFDLLNLISPLEISSTLAPLFSQVFLESIFDLLILTKGQKGFLNKHYTTYVSHIARILKISKPADILSQLFREKAKEFFENLNRRELWEEIVDLYLSIHSYLEDSLEVNTIILKACNRCAYTSLGKKFTLREFNQILDKIALENENDLNQQMGILCGVLFDAAEDLKDFLGALQCLERQKIYFLEQDDFYHERLLRIASELIPTENYRVVYDPLIQLKTPLNSESQWLKLIKLLLEQKQINFCLKLIESKINLLGMQDKNFYHEWINLLDGMLNEGEKLFDAEDKLSLEQKKSLYTIIHQVMWQCMPKNEELWEKYRHLVSQKGPINLVEKIFEKMLEPDFEEFPILGKNLRINFWRSVLYRFSKEPGMAILNIERCWPPFCRVTELADEIDRIKMGKEFLYAVYGALETAKPNKRDKVAKVVADLFMISDNNIRLLVCAADTEADPKLLLLLAKINLFVSGGEYLIVAIYSLITIFDQVRTDIEPILKEECLLLMKDFMEISRKFYQNNPTITTGMLGLINIFLLNNYSSADTDYFPALNYLHQIEEKGIEQDKAVKQHLEKKTKLLKLIVENPWKNRHPTQEQKDLVRKTLRQICTCQLVHIIKLTQQFIEHPDLNIYISENKSIQKKVNIIKKVTLTSYEIFRTNMAENDRTMKILEGRFKLTQEYKYPLKLMPHEKEAMISQCKHWVALLTVMLVITGFSLRIFYDISSQPNLNK
jgi:hypothetical protein